MQRIRIFLKGNLDLYDSLHSCRINNILCWNGINEVEAIKNAGVRFQIKHETFTRTDALLKTLGDPPKSLVDRNPFLGSFTSKSQFSQDLFNANVDAYVLSIQPDIAIRLVRHKSEGYLLHVAHLSLWDREDLDWLQTNFEPMKLLTPLESIKNLQLIIKRIRAISDAPIIIYNASSVIIGEQVHCYIGLKDSLSLRIKKFNLGLIELSNKTGISIVDIDRVIACHGANHLKLDTWHLNPDALKLIANEVARILLELIPTSAES